MKLIDYPTNEICDVIFLTNTNDDQVYRMTLNAINSLIKSEENNKFRIILVESNLNNPPKYNVDIYLKYTHEFNYNEALMMAFEYIQSDYIYISNNDVEFHENWYSIIRYYMDAFSLDSASPRCKENQFGINKEAQNFILSLPDFSVHINGGTVTCFAGWGWIISRQCLSELIENDGFNNFGKFWFQDDHILLTLKQMGKRHGCVTSSNVTHFGQRSYPLIPEDKLHGMTMGIYDAFVQKWAHLK